MKKIGVHARGHDACVAVIDHDKKSIRATSYERITREKHDPRFPLELLLEELSISEKSTLVFPMKHVTGEDFEHFEALVAWAPVSRRMRGLGLLQRFLYLAGHLDDLRKAFRFLLHRELKASKVSVDKFSKAVKKKLFGYDLGFEFFDHHTAHAASAYYFAPRHFENESLVLTFDGQGDGSFCKVFTVSDNRLIPEASSSPASSVPLLFSVATSALGFNPNSDEGKLEALAAYGDLSSENPIHRMLTESFQVSEDLEICLVPTSSFPFDDMSRQWAEIRRHFVKLLVKHQPKDVAAGVQSFYEEFMLAYILRVRQRFDNPRLCLAGGGFANVKLNRRIYESGAFQDIFIFPAMGDEGAVLGALALSETEAEVQLDWIRDLEMPFFGQSFSKNEVQRVLSQRRDLIEFEDVGEDYHRMLARDLYEMKICAHFNGKMEFGPRALGNRSILANPMSETIREDLNLKFKQREWFQPFCPSILETEARELFENFYLNRHMTCAFTMKERFRPLLPGIVHVDGTSRAQFVNESNNSNLFKILTHFKTLTGHGALINTSFNIHGRAIVRTPDDAIQDFLDCNIDVLYIEGFRVRRIPLRHPRPDA